MDADAEFASLTNFFAAVSSCAEKAMADHESSERLIACAEYELGEVRRALADPLGVSAMDFGEKVAPDIARVPFRRPAMAPT